VEVVLAIAAAASVASLAGYAVGRFRLEAQVAR
jgi:hypothetical protein